MTTINLFFGSKVKTNLKINLIEKIILVTSNEEIAKMFKEYFDEIVPKLNIIPNGCQTQKTGHVENLVKKASFKY